MRRNVFSAATAAIVGAVIASAAPSWAQINPNTDTCTPVAPASGSGFCLAGSITAASGGSDGAIASRVQTYAKEIFGEGSRDTELTLPVGTTVTLAANFSGTNVVDAGKRATITFRLNDGVLFAANVGALAFSEGGTPQPTKISQSDSSGGRKGDASVNYVIEVGDTNLTAPNSVFTFTVPKLMNATVLGGNVSGDRQKVVSMTVTVEPESGRFDTGNKFPMFPATGSDDDDNVRVLARSLLLFPLTLTPSSEQTVNINIDDRTAFVTPNDNVVTVTGTDFSEGRPALKIASVDIDQGPAAGADTSAFSASSGDMVHITARGPFGTGDILFLSTDRTLSTTGPEATRDPVFTITGSTATSSVPLTSIRTTAGGNASGGIHSVYLIPAAGSNLNRGLYQAEFEVDFAEETMKDTEDESAGVRLEYSNLSVQGYAYAIPNPGAADIGNLRLRCESSGDCAVFLDCQDQSGTTIGGFPELTVMPKATIVLNTKSTTPGTSLARALGVETWPGRLSCEILSNANIGVQVLTRSNGTLVNNTYVSGSEPAASTP